MKWLLTVRPLGTRNVGKTYAVLDRGCISKLCSPLLRASGHFKPGARGTYSFRSSHEETQIEVSVCTRRAEQSQTEMATETERHGAIYPLGEADAPEAAGAVRLLEVALLPKTAEVKSRSGFTAATLKLLEGQQFRFASMVRSEGFLERSVCSLNCLAFHGALH